MNFEDFYGACFAFGGGELLPFSFTLIELLTKRLNLFLNDFP